ncbi:MAG: hypothetical protein M5U26_14310 [Planctomycetota bacterium]|nr:hypothetical protein [Planctomycetota bacterium]
MLALFALWLVAFLVLNLATHREGALLYTQNKFHIFGIPPWLIIMQDGPMQYPGEPEPSKSWGSAILYEHILAAIAIPFAPIGLFLFFFCLTKKRLQFHLTTVLLCSILASVHLGLSLTQRDDLDLLHAGEIGWPISFSANRYFWTGLISDLSVAVFLLFFTALACEAWIRRKRLLSIARESTKVSESSNDQ